MDKQIEKFDPSKLMDGVRDRIKSTFVSLIPDEMWSTMVEKEIYVFTTGKIVTHHEYQGTGKDGKSKYLDWEERVPYKEQEVKDSFGRVIEKGEISPLRQMIRDELEKRFRRDLAKWLDGEEYQQAFDEHGGKQISKAVRDVLVENADTIFYKVMANMMQTAFNMMRQDINYAVGNQY